MAIIKYFIGRDFLTDNGVIGTGVDVNDYAGLIQGAATSFLKKQIGSYFFNDLLIKYNYQTLSPDEIILVEQMQFAIAWRVRSEATKNLTYQLKNKGLQKQNDDNSESVAFDEFSFMVDDALQKAIFFELEIREFLTEPENNVLFSEFNNNLNKDSSIKNKFCGLNNGYNEGVGIFVI